MPKNPRSYEKTRHIALSGLLFALAMALSFIEGSLVIPGLLPGMKLGLANIVVMYALFFMGVKQALVLDVLKALFVFLVSGFTAGFLSLCGGLLSLLVMAVLYYVVPVRPTSKWTRLFGNTTSPRRAMAGRCSSRRSALIVTFSDMMQTPPGCRWMVLSGSPVSLGFSHKIKIVCFFIILISGQNATVAAVASVIRPAFRGC